MLINPILVGYYRITINEADLGLKGKYIVHVEADLDLADPDSTEIDVTVRPEPGDDWDRTYFDCTVAEFFNHYEAEEIGYYRTGNGVF